MLLYSHNDEENEYQWKNWKVVKYLRCNLSLLLFGGRFDALLSYECFQYARVRILWISKVQNFYKSSNQKETLSIYLFISTTKKLWI